MRRALQLTLLSLTLSIVQVTAQNEISFVVGSGPEVRNEAGTSLELPWIGGLNQPQFYTLDINNDEIDDLFVFDRSGNKVISLIGDGKGKYEYHPEFDQIYPVSFADWVVFKDFDGDGLKDIWYKDENENSAIALWKNITKTGDQHMQFELVDNILRAYNYGDPPLDSSNLYCDKANIPAIEDVDGDGDVDFLTLQLFGSGITLFRNLTVENNLPLNPPVFAEADVCWGDFQEGTSENEIILERSQWCFRKLKKHAGGSSLLLIDGDEDDDMDLILGNAGFGNLIYLENGRIDVGTTQDTMIAFEPNFPSNSRQAKINTFPSAFYQDINNDDINDLVVAVNYTDKSSGFYRETGNLLYYENTGKNNKPVFEFRDSLFLVDQILDHGGHTSPLFWDFDGDNDDDIILATNGDWGLSADKHDKLILYENIGSASKAIFQFAKDDYLGLEKDSISRMMPSLGDLNRDGDMELLIGQVNGSLSLYNIIGSGKTASAKLVSNNSFGINVGSASAPNITDVDGDGYLDLLVGCYDGNTFHFKNTSKTDIPAFVAESDTFGGIMANTLISQMYYRESADTFYDSLVYFSFGYSSPFLHDLDGNGDPELILGTASGAIKISRDVRQHAGQVFEVFETINYLTDNKECYNFKFGSVTVAAMADLDNDGVVDMVIGNNRGGMHFLQGTEDCNPLSVGINTIQNTIKIYPNPTNGHLHFEGLNQLRMSAKVYNLTGLMVKSESLEPDEPLDVSDLNSGMYFILIQQGDAAYSGKFIKRK